MGGYGSVPSEPLELPIASHAEVGLGVFRLTRSSCEVVVALCWGFVFRMLLVWFWSFCSFSVFVKMAAIILSAGQYTILIRPSLTFSRTK